MTILIVVARGIIETGSVRRKLGETTSSSSWNGILVLGTVAKGPRRNIEINMSDDAPAAFARRSVNRLKSARTGRRSEPREQFKIPQRDRRRRYTFYRRAHLRRYGSVEGHVAGRCRDGNDRHRRYSRSWTHTAGERLALITHHRSAFSPP